MRFCAFRLKEEMQHCLGPNATLAAISLIALIIHRQGGQPRALLHEGQTEPAADKQLVHTSVGEYLTKTSNNFNDALAAALTLLLLLRPLRCA